MTPARIVAVIPARMGSARFPGKPLAPIRGLPMIEHVYRRTAMCTLVSDVFIATCDQEIRAATEAFGGKAIMTSTAHQRASDRVAEAAEELAADVVVMVQGDEPMTHPAMLEAAIWPFQEAQGDVECVNLMARIPTRDEFEDRNTIKVVTDSDGFALYMSREPIPTEHLADFDALPAFKQVCVIPFAAAALQRFARLPPTPLEEIESIDMLRFMEHGYKVKMIETKYRTHAVDTAEDLKLVEEFLNRDPLVSEYSTGI
jgi:3-deoxy-manno-octulosonate cytidylyltransferase (CMP-KDO synthetase)